MRRFSHFMRSLIVRPPFYFLLESALHVRLSDYSIEIRLFPIVILRKCEEIAEVAMW